MNVDERMCRANLLMSHSNQVPLEVQVSCKSTNGQLECTQVSSARLGELSISLERIRPAEQLGRWLANESNTGAHTLPCELARPVIGRSRVIHLRHLYRHTCYSQILYQQRTSLLCFRQPSAQFSPVLFCSVQFSSVLLCSALLDQARAACASEQSE